MFKLASPNDLKAIQLTVADTELMNDITAEFGAGAGLVSSFLPVRLDSSNINLPQVRPAVAGMKSSALAPAWCRRSCPSGWTAPTSICPRCGPL
jgi:hypothetical protein